MSDWVLLAACADEEGGGGLYAWDGHMVERLDDVNTCSVGWSERGLLRLLWSKPEDEAAALLLYDADGLRERRRLPGLADAHHVAWDGECCLISSTGTNSLVWISPSGERREWKAPGAGDAWHMNSVWLQDGDVFVSAFGRFLQPRGWHPHRRDGSGVVFSLNTGRDVLIGLNFPHHPVYLPGAWLVCSSADHEVLKVCAATGETLRRLRLPGWTRGLALSREHLFVGVSAPRHDPASPAERAGIAIVARKTGIVERMVPLSSREVGDLALVPRSWLGGLRASSLRERLELLAAGWSSASLPGSVSVAAGPDPDALFRGLTNALPGARYILVQGALLSPAHAAAAAAFSQRYRDAIELGVLVPGEGGHLLIKTRPAECVPERADSLALRSAYQESYFLTDCGGYAEYLRTGGKKLEDGRLLSVAHLGSLKAAGRCLELGCGRGELARYFAARGFEVTAIDYSPAAITLAERALEDDQALRARVTLLCDDVGAAPLAGPYDLAVASDLIEHLSPAEVEGLYARVSAAMAPDGIFVIHTFPNAWYYRYDYPRRRRAAARAGAWLPPDPRTRYESLMHINEQSPRVLRDQLGRHFGHVLLWFGDAIDPRGSLARPRLSTSFARSAPDLYAIASHAPVMPGEVLDVLSMPALGVVEVAIEAVRAPRRVTAGTRFESRVRAANRSPIALRSLAPHPVHLSYNWLRDNQVVVFDGYRTRLTPPLEAGASREYAVHILAPERPGNYTLRHRLVQEGVRWFDDYLDVAMLVE